MPPRGTPDNPRRPEWPAEVHDEAFVVWTVHAGRSARETARLLAEMEADLAAAEGREPEPTPSHDAIWRWSVQHDWAHRAWEYTRRNHGKYRAAALAQFAIDEWLVAKKYHEILTDPTPLSDLKQAQAALLAQALKELPAIMGVGTYGAKGTTDLPPPPSITAGDVTTPEDRALRQAQRLALPEGEPD